MDSLFESYVSFQTFWTFFIPLSKSSYPVSCVSWAEFLAYTLWRDYLQDWISHQSCFGNRDNGPKLFLCLLFQEYELLAAKITRSQSHCLIDLPSFLVYCISAWFWDGLNLLAANLKEEAAIILLVISIREYSAIGHDKKSRTLHIFKWLPPCWILLYLSPSPKVPKMIYENAGLLS